MDEYRITLDGLGRVIDQVRELRAAGPTRKRQLEAPPFDESMQHAMRLLEDAFMRINSERAMNL
jgi:hypothetical protein